MHYIVVKQRKLLLYVSKSLFKDEFYSLINIMISVLLLLKYIDYVACLIIIKVHTC